MSLNLLKGRCFWTVKPSSKSSWCWNKLLELRTEVRQIIAFKVGNEQQIFLWHDQWHPKGPMLQTYGPRLLHLPGLHMNNRLSTVIHGDQWVWPAARTDEMLRCFGYCGHIQPRNTGDEVVWIPSLFNKYHTGDTWNWIREFFFNSLVVSARLVQRCSSKAELYLLPCNAEQINY